MIKKNKRGWRQSFFQLWQSSWPERHIILWDTGQNFKWTFGQFKEIREKKGENRWHKLDLSAQTIAVAVLVGKVQKQIAAMPTNCVFLVKKTLAEPFDPFCMAQRIETFKFVASQQCKRYKLLLCSEGGLFLFISREYIHKHYTLNKLLTPINSRWKNRKTEVQPLRSWTLSADTNLARARLTVLSPNNRWPGTNKYLY